MKKEQIIKLAQKTITAEAKAVLGLKKSLNKNFVEIINRINSVSGKIVLCGIGKSGIIARKISATLSSVGFESVYIHPVEALHGDMGMLSKQDFLLAFSNSGQTEELNLFLKHAKRRNIRICAITSNLSSSMAKLADYTLDIGVKKEACLHNLIPTSSTTAMLALGDAISITLMSLSGFKKDDFANHHPKGKLGKILNVSISSVMRTGEKNPKMHAKGTIKEAIKKMTTSRLGAVSIIDSKQKLIGFFTDGDLRRNFFSIKDTDKIEKHMTKNPLSISCDKMANDAAKIMEEKKIDNLPVVGKKHKLVGVIDERDLIREGLI